MSKIEMPGLLLMPPEEKRLHESLEQARDVGWGILTLTDHEQELRESYLDAAEAYGDTTETEKVANQRPSFVGGYRPKDFAQTQENNEGEAMGDRNRSYQEVDQEPGRNGMPPRTVPNERAWFVKPVRAYRDGVSRPIANGLMRILTKQYKGFGEDLDFAPNSMVQTMWFGWDDPDKPVTENLQGELLRLPDGPQDEIVIGEEPDLPKEQNPHTDKSNPFTFLFSARRKVFRQQGGGVAPGLEAFGQDGKWDRLSTGPDQLLILPQDGLEMLTEGVYKATRHRVVKWGIHRISSGDFLYLPLRKGLRADVAQMCIDGLKTFNLSEPESFPA
jgi:isopenicillin N synthase-like dioxygenase